jgi:methionyl aminopeptidase
VEKEILDSYMLAGKINFEALNLGVKLIKPGASMISILDEIEAFIKSKNAWPAFPAQISLNNIAAHFCPVNSDVILKVGDVVKLDVGVSVNGYIADAARTVDLGDNKELVLSSKKALENVLKIVKPGVTLGELGLTIQETINAQGFVPIKNLSGHGLGQFQVHVTPSIPNISTGSKIELKEGQVIAIEPFATNGAGIVYEGGIPTVFSFVGGRQVRSPSARKMIDDIKEFNGLPFTTRWLMPKYGFAATQLALRDMTVAGVVHAHPPLLEKDKGLVAQWEHSVIVKEKSIVFTRHNEE